MDLALHFGMPVSALSQDLTERELGLWAAYDRVKGLPFHRLELMLATLTLWTTRVWGSAEYKIDDFLLDHRKVWSKREDTADTAAAAIGSIAGGVKVIKLGQGRKRG